MSSMIQTSRRREAASRAKRAAKTVAQKTHRQQESVQIKLRKKTWGF